MAGIANGSVKEGRERASRIMMPSHYVAAARVIARPYEDIYYPIQALGEEW